MSNTDRDLMKLVTLFSQMGITEKDVEEDPEARRCLRRVLRRGMYVVNGVSWADDVEAVEVSQEPRAMADPETGESRPRFLLRASLLLEKSRWVPANADGTVNAEARDEALADMRESFKGQFRT